MQINYLDAISSVLNMMKQPDSACKNIDMHRTCYTTLFKYLMDKGIPTCSLEISKVLSAAQKTVFSAGAEYRNPFFA